MVTNANPRDLPVIRSIMRRTSLTWPCCSNRSRRSFSVVSKERLPTYSFIVFEFGKTKQLQSRSRESGFKPPNERCSPDDLPCREVKQSNLISAHYRVNCPEHKRSFQGMFGGVCCRKPLSTAHHKALMMHADFDVGH